MALFVGLYNSILLEFCVDHPVTLDGHAEDNVDKGSVNSTRTDLGKSSR